MAIDFRDPQLQKALIILLLVAGVIGIYGFTDYLPICYPVTKKEIVKLDKEIQDIQAKINSIGLEAGEVERLREELQVLSKELEKAKAMLPQEVEMIKFMETLTRSARQTGLELTLIHPDPPQKRGIYTAIPISVIGTGGYHQLGMFMNSLANQTRIIAVKDIEVGKSKDTNSQATIEAKMIIETYMMEGGAE